MFFYFNANFMRVIEAMNEAVDPGNAHPVILLQPLLTPTCSHSFSRAWIPAPIQCQP